MVFGDIPKLSWLHHFFFFSFFLFFMCTWLCFTIVASEMQWNHLGRCANSHIARASSVTGKLYILVHARKLLNNVELVTWHRRKSKALPKVCFPPYFIRNNCLWHCTLYTAMVSASTRSVCTRWCSSRYCWISGGSLTHGSLSCRTDNKQVNWLFNIIEEIRPSFCKQQGTDCGWRSLFWE